MNMTSVFSYFIKSDYNRGLFSYFFGERKKQKMSRNGQRKKLKNNRAVT